MVAAKAKKGTKLDRPVKYPNRLKSAVGELITVKKAIELLGWEIESEGNKFGTDYLFEVGKAKIRCTNNVTNRPLYMSNVETLKRDILNKSWKYNAEPIIIGKTGLVLNGQHTLAAIILAEEDRVGKDKEWWAKIWRGPIAIDKDVTYGVDEDDATVNTMDTCKPRTLMDVLYRSEYFKDLAGAERKTVARALSFAIQLLWQRAGGAAGGHVGKDKGKHTHAEYLDFLERHPKLLDAVRHIHQENANNAISKYLTVGYSSAVMYMMAASDTEKEVYDLADIKSEKVINFDKWEHASGFWVKLASGVDEFAGVRYALGKLDDVDSGVVGGKDEKIAVLALAWDKFREDKTPTEKDCTLSRTQPDPDGNTHVESWPDFGGIDRGMVETKANTDDDDQDDGTGGSEIADHPEESGKPKAKVNQGPDPEALRAMLTKLKEENENRVLLIRNPEAWVLWEDDAETYFSATGKKFVERNGLKCANFKPEELEPVARKLVEYGEKLTMCYPNGKDWTVQNYEPQTLKDEPVKAKVKPGGVKAPVVEAPKPEPAKPAGAKVKPGGKK